MTQHTPLCQSCIRSMGLSHRQTHQAHCITTRCAGCDKVRPCLVTRKKILDFRLFFNHAKQKETA